MTSGGAVHDGLDLRYGVSLFTGAGIGDLGFRSAGIEFLVMSEIDPPRAEVAAKNFPETKMVVGDIWDTWPQIVDLARAELESRDAELFLVTCTAPCQGMSKNGQGTLLRNARLGKRPKLDPRNRLILPALDAISVLQPLWVVFENVSEMANTMIEDEHGELRAILDIIEDRLGSAYVGRAYDLECADYGIPQRRRRLITVFTRDEKARELFDLGGELVPPATHASKPSGSRLPWISVVEALGTDFPPLDAKSTETAVCREVPFHRVPVLDERKYEWVSHAAPGASAFDNQCSACGFDENPVHGTTRNDAGINQANTTTPLYCARCGELLPRPHVEEKDGSLRIMRGYTSAYKRMAGGLPAPALTRNLSYACSDQKLHPIENRVLSLAEAFRVHTLDDYEFEWVVESKRGGAKAAPDALIRLALGESVPPRLLQQVAQHLVAITMGEVVPPTPADAQLSMTL